MKINKTINKEKYTFYLQFEFNTMNAKIRYFQSDEWIICRISSDFKYINIPEGKLNIAGINIVKMKLNKDNILEAKDYNCKLF